MQSLERLEPETARRLRGFLFDLDDTLLDHGKLTESAYSALFRLRESGLALVAVTGRPAAWCALLARQWPIDGAIGENGAVSFVARSEGPLLLDAASAEERERRQSALGRIVAELRATFPELEPADDVAGRVSDFAFDIGEHRRVEPALVARVRDEARRRGAWTTVSSVHLHVSLDGDDKASGAVRLLRRLFELDAARARSEFAFIGDSENDAACFAAFRTTIGVHNFCGRPSVAPRFITRESRGAGFAEAARRLVALRAG